MGGQAVNVSLAAYCVSPSGFRAPYAAIILPEFENHNTRAQQRWSEAEE